MGPARCVQVWPDGARPGFAVTMRGRMRVGWVEVEHTGRDRRSPAWLRPGRHPALLLEGVQVVAAPR